MAVDLSDTDRATKKSIAVISGFITAEDMPRSDTYIIAELPSNIIVLSSVVIILTSFNAAGFMSAGAVDNAFTNNFIREFNCEDEPNTKFTRDINTWYSAGPTVTIKVDYINSAPTAGKALYYIEYSETDITVSDES